MMPKAVDEALDRDERERERRLSELGISANATSLELLQQVYRNHSLPLSTRMRAAATALPFEHPKLSVIASFDGEDFADRMERATRRSSNVIEHDQPQALSNRSFRRA